MKAVKHDLREIEMKKVKQFNDKIAVYFDKEWEVYKVVVDGRPEATAEEDDKQDAFDTAECMVKHMAEHPEVYEAEPLPENVIAREGEWDIGLVKQKVEDVYCEDANVTVLWFGHHTTDEEMGCGQITVINDEVIDYDGVYELRPEVIKLLARQGYDVSYLESE